MKQWIVDYPDDDAGWNTAKIVMGSSLKWYDTQLYSLDSFPSFWTQFIKLFLLPANIMQMDRKVQTFAEQIQTV